MLWDTIGGSNIWETMVAYLRSWFDYSGAEGKLILISAALALVFGIIWLFGYRPPFLKKPQLWLTAIFSALIPIIGIAFIYLPLSYFFLTALQPDSVFMLLLYMAPVALLSGWVQETTKMIPMLFFLRGSDKNDPKMGIIIGAVAGAGFGIFQLFWTCNQAFTLGWRYDGIMSLLPFWFAFWTLALHIGLSSFVGYGITKGRTSKYLSTAALIQALAAYLPILLVVITDDETTTYNILAIIIPIAVVIIMAISYKLRWQKYGIETPAVTPAVRPAASITPAVPATPTPVPPVVSITPAVSATPTPVTPVVPITPAAPAAPPVTPPIPSTSPAASIIPAPQPIPPAKPPQTPTSPTAYIQRSWFILPDNSKIAIENSVKIIGRSDLEKVFSPDNLKYVSRRHFIINSEGGKYYIEDLNSANGTKVNGIDIKGKGKQEIKDGDKIDLANTVVLTFRVESTF